MYLTCTATLGGLEVQINIIGKRGKKGTRTAVLVCLFAFNQQG